MLISDLVAAGLRCPNCEGREIRGGYHDWQRMDSFICEECGLHWMEDCPADMYEKIDYKQRRFLWVMVDTKYPTVPILNSDTAEGKCTRTEFVRKGVRWE